MKELFQGRRFGFAPRPILAFLAVGLAIGVTLVDLMAYFAWGSRETNGYVVVAYWLAIGTAIVAGGAAVGAVPEVVGLLFGGGRACPPEPEVGGVRGFGSGAAHARAGHLAATAGLPPP